MIKICAGENTTRDTSEEPQEPQKGNISFFIACCMRLFYFKNQRETDKPLALHHIMKVKKHIALHVSVKKMICIAKGSFCLSGASSSGGN